MAHHRVAWATRISILFTHVAWATRGPASSRIGGPARQLIGSQRAFARLCDTPGASADADASAGARRPERARSTGEIEQQDDRFAGAGASADADASAGARRPERARSTGEIEQQDNRFAGADARRARLHAALLELHGADALDFLSEPAFAGSAALRCYDSFVHPRTEGALQASDKPSRARVIANQIVFHVRELRAHRAAWLRNTDAVLAADGRRPPHELTLLLDNVRSAHNVGSLFRLAECAGLAEVITTGITPAPPHPALLKTALGTAERVRTRHVPSALDAVAQLQAAGVRVCAAETVEGSASLYDEGNARLREALGSPLAIVFGNELVGVDARVLARCDAIVHLPTFGAKNSLNVATCATALVYEILRRWGKLDAAAGGASQ